MTLRIVFMGTPEFAVSTLIEIVGQGHEVVAVYTREPKPAGRGLELQRSPVHRQAALLGIPVHTPKSLKCEEASAAFAAHQVDVGVVVAYGMILPEAILAAPRLGCLNLHASLLPRWRGAAPIQRAIMAGDAETGVMVMRMDKGLDTGPVAMAERIAIGPDMSAQALHDSLMPLGADLMARALAALSRGALQFKAQPTEGVTYAAKITKEEARLDWSRPARAVHDQIRGLSPFPGAFIELPLPGGPIRVKILASSVIETKDAPGTLIADTINGTLALACAEGAVRLTEVQRAGKAPMEASEFLRGNALPPRLALA